jgi:hypothetical protein
MPPSIYNRVCLALYACLFLFASGAFAQIGTTSLRG